MISVILIEPARWPASTDRAYLCARSMPWLVSAVVGGFVRDLVLAVGATAPILDLAERVGCSVADAGSGDALEAALLQVRSPLVLALEIGFEPVGDLAAELDRYAFASKPLPALLLSEPTRRLTALFRKPGVVGGLAQRDMFLLQGRSVLRRRRGTPLLATTMRPVD